jgi:3-oxoacyl-[acyl-carrier protein] reductase
VTPTVLVTGSSRGIGRAIALSAAKSGYDIVVHCRQRLTDAEAVRAEIDSLGRKARVLTFDVSDREAAKAALSADIERHGAYYGVVLSAGISRDAAFPAMTDDQWDDVLKTNLGGFYNVLRPVVMPMVQRRQAGRIIAISSVSGLIGNRGQVNYSATKAGLMGAVKALAVELAKRSITVNCVAPGLIDTEMVTPEVVEHAMEMIPMRRMGTADEVAHAVDFLLSPKASYITRQVLAVNGGLC